MWQFLSREKIWENWEVFFFTKSQPESTSWVCFFKWLKCSERNLNSRGQYRQLMIFFSSFAFKALYNCSLRSSTNTNFLGPSGSGGFEVDGSGEGNFAWKKNQIHIKIFRIFLKHTSEFWSLTKLVFLQQICVQWWNCTEMTPFRDFQITQGSSRVPKALTWLP